MDLSTIIITTERLKLVSVTLEYVPDIYREFTEDITRCMLVQAPKKIEETYQYIHSVLPKMRQGEELGLTIFHKETGELLGGGGIHDIKTKTPRLGIWIKTSAQGNKYGKEAVSAIKAWVDANLTYTYIVYTTDKQNIPSRKITESLGSVIIREYKRTHPSGEISDGVEYKILKKS